MPVRLGRSLLLLILLAGLLGCGLFSDDGSDDGAEGLRALFVGNSLTYTNDLPAAVAALAEAAGQPALVYETIARANFSLEDHWHSGEAPGALESGEWDVAVFQQGPSSLPENQENLRTWATRFADAARAAGTTPALYMVWPGSDRRHAFGDVVQSYSEAAVAAGAQVLPAGVAWQRAWAQDERLPLYGADGFHPSPLGTFLAALVVYGGLYGELPEALPARVVVGGEEVLLSRPLAEVLLKAAGDALATYE